MFNTSRYWRLCVCFGAREYTKKKDQHRIKKKKKANRKSHQNNHLPVDWLNFMLNLAGKKLLQKYKHTNVVNQQIEQIFFVWR